MPKGAQRRRKAPKGTRRCPKVSNGVQWCSKVPKGAESYQKLPKSAQRCRRSESNNWFPIALTDIWINILKKLSYEYSRDASSVKQWAFSITKSPKYQTKILPLISYTLNFSTEISWIILPNCLFLSRSDKMAIMLALTVKSSIFQKDKEKLLQ